MIREIELRIENIKMIKDYSLYYDRELNIFYINSLIDDFSISSDNFDDILNEIENNNMIK